MLLAVLGLFIVLAVIGVAVPNGHTLVISSFGGAWMDPSCLFRPAGGIMPLSVLAIEINLFAFFFNLLPIPPLDGSRVLRNLLPYSAVQFYDRIPMWVSYLLS